MNLSILIDINLDNNELSIRDYAKMLCISRIQLYRRIKNATTKSPSTYIRHYRLQKAASLIEQGESSISKVSMQVGFGNKKYFSSSFKELYGHSPSEYYNTTISITSSVK